MPQPSHLFPEPPLAEFDPSHTPLDLDMDENLFWQARQRLHDCHQEMRELMAQTPSVRSSIRRLIKQQLDLDADQVGLHFPPTASLPRSRFSLTDACGYLLRHPDADITALRAGEVVSLPAGHRQDAWSVGRLLAALKELNLRQGIHDGWTDYWMSRAPGTPVSRRSRASQLYRIHFEASAHLAQARHVERADPLKTLFALLDPTSEQSSLNGQTLYSEQLLLKLNNGPSLPLPGAWVITLDNEEPVSQLLYLPFHEPAWQVFSHRAAMERWLLDHQMAVFQVAQADPLAIIGYRLQTAPLQVGISQWLAALAEAQYHSAVAPSEHTDMLEGSAYALLATDELDRQRQHAHLFAPPPAQPAVLGQDAVVEAPSFGLLSLDLSASQRQAMIQHAVSAFEAQLDEAHSGEQQPPRLIQFKQQLDTLHEHQQAASNAASVLLNRRVFDIPTLNTQYTALYHARCAGLRAEAQLQHSLNQLSANQLAWVQTVLDAPVAANREPTVVVAALMLSITQQADATTTTVSTSELNGPLLITTAEALHAAPAAPHSLLLYWPGTAGALQRFDSRHTLEQWLLRVPGEDEPAPSVQFKVLSEDPFDYSLKLQHNTFEEQAAHIRATYPAPLQAKQQVQALETLRLKTIDSLLVPVNEARDAAYLQILEQYNSSHLLNQLPQWLKNLAVDERTTLKKLTQAYIRAWQRCQVLIDRSLPRRDEYLRLQIDARLRKDFALTHGFSVQLELPDSVEKKRDVVTGAAPGTPVKIIDVPSPQRSPMSLETLALGNIDSNLSLRLGFMSTTIEADDRNELEILKAGINPAYLRRLVRDLDLARQYQELIYATFKGSTQESLFETQYRRECLLQPWRLTLQLQGECARLQGHIDADALRLLLIAIDADHRQAWQPRGMRVRLLPAHLAAGGKDTQEQSPITLSGVSFIEEQNSGLTLLYLPDVPDGRFLRSYASLEQARRALFELCRLDSMVNYLAGRALTGEVRAHVSRIDRAHENNFDAMLGVGAPWPVSTSLAAHLLDAQMGRLIEAHRNDSRANDDLLLEQYALSSASLFNGIKIALGFLPVIGTAVNLYDGVSNLYGAVQAFAQGQTHHGIEQLASVFDSLVYAALDIAPTFATAAAGARSARHLTRLRQASRPLRQQHFWTSLTRHKAHTLRPRFAGYAYEKPISLANLQADSHGIYRQVYRHPEGDFIVSQGQVFQVQYDKTHQTLRLSGTRTRTYQQPIGLDDSGQWNTHGALYGALVEDGLAAGGNVVGHLADRLEPFWPLAVRQWLPRWWTDRAWRQHQLLMGRINSTERSMTTSAAQVNRLLERYQAGDLSVIGELESAMDTLSRLATNIDQDLNRISAYVRGNRASVLKKARGDAARDVCHCAQYQIKFSVEQFLKMGDQTNDAISRLNALPFDQVAARTAQRAQLRQLRIQTFDALRRIDSAMERMNYWLPQVQGQHRKVMVTAAEVLNRGFSERRRAQMKTTELMDLIVHRKPGQDVSWHYLQGPLRNAEEELSRALYLQTHLLEAGAGPAQRNRILRYCIAVYENYQRHLNSWMASVPQHFDDTYVVMMRSEVSSLRARAEKTITSQAQSTPGSSNKRVFESEDNVLLIGQTTQASATQARRYSMTGPRGHEQIWEQGANGKFHLTNPVATSPWRPTPQDLAPLTQQARRQLDGLAAHHARVEGYARQRMNPADLEFMMTSEADKLNLQATHIEELDPQAPIIQSLRRKALELSEQGRQLRITQILDSQTPTEGYLDYLLNQRLEQKPIVDIHKSATLEALGRRADGRPDFLQEYEIRDLRQASPKVLWYAHFHYEKNPPEAFDSFVKAHLKLPEQRRSGLKWQQAQAQSQLESAVTPIWRGNIDKPLARLHFQHV